MMAASSRTKAETVQGQEAEREETMTWWKRRRQAWTLFLWQIVQQKGKESPSLCLHLVALRSWTNQLTLLPLINPSHLARQTPGWQKRDAHTQTQVQTRWEGTTENGEILTRTASDPKQRSWGIQTLLISDWLLAGQSQTTTALRL